MSLLLFMCFKQKSDILNKKNYIPMTYKFGWFLCEFITIFYDDFFPPDSDPRFMKWIRIRKTAILSLIFCKVF